MNLLAFLSQIVSSIKQVKTSIPAFCFSYAQTGVFDVKTVWKPIPLEQKNTVLKFAYFARKHFIKERVLSVCYHIYLP